MIGTESALSRDAQRILATVERIASRRKRRALVALVGLPASGKSRVAEELRARTGAAVLESDALRRLLFRRRSYSAVESRRLFAAIHTAIDALLSDGISVILDATNLAESERTPLYAIAEACSARLVLVYVTAPHTLARRRLARRAATGASPSEADLRVYERMQARVEDIRRPHHVIDTSSDIGPALSALAREMLEP